MPPLPPTIRQAIVDILKLRYAAISVANGFETDLGQRPIDEWSVAYQQDECPAIAIFDLVNKTLQGFPREKRVGNTLPMQTRLFLKRDTPPALVRKMIADLMKATVRDHVTGEYDPTFGGLAVDTRPDEDGFIIPENTFQIDGAAIAYTVEFLSAPFNAYE